MRCITVLLCLMAAVSACSFYGLVEQEWMSFKLEHNKIYDNEVEDRFRMKIYVENKLIIAKHNQLYRKGLVSYSLKQNQYGDMLPHEFILAMNGFNNNTVFNTRGATFLAPAHASIPDHADWTKKGAVTEVKNQQRCGSCWAFSATGALEGQHYRKTGYLVSLSEQNLIDCSSPYGNDGCNGGHMIAAFIYVKANGGIDTEKSYPYEGTEGQCRYNPKNSGADDVGFVRLPSADEKALMQAVATVGPVSVAIDASQKQFMFYSGGVYFDKGCSSSKLNHGVLVVGYGTDEVGGDYWLVKNSWGRSWGALGYIKMARNRDNHCGIATDASYPLV